MTVEVPGTLRPSSSDRWGPDGCPGSFAMEQHFPEDTESEKAREGTAGHHYATEAVQGRIVPLGTLAPNGYPIDQEMIDGGAHFVADVLAEIAEASPRAIHRTETRVFMHGLVHPDNDGTPDWWMADYDRKRIVVVDYKYGHRVVPVFRHWQTLDYAVGVVEGLQLTWEEVADWTIRLVIVQPRDYGSDPVKEWVITGAQLKVYAEQLERAAAAAKTPNAPCLTGPHCRDCRAQHACDANRTMGHTAMDIAGESTPHVIDDVALGLELTKIDTALKRLEARRTGLQEVAIAKIQSGQPIRGWTMEPGDTREKWLKPPEEVFALGSIFGVDLHKPAEPITPAQARKAGVDATVIKAYAGKPPGAFKLKPADPNSAAKAFSKGT